MFISLKLKEDIVDLVRESCQEQNRNRSNWILTAILEKLQREGKM